MKLKHILILKDDYFKSIPIPKNHFEEIPPDFSLNSKLKP